VAEAEPGLRDLTEPDVALTDYAVALECALLTGLLFRRVTRRGHLRRLFAIFFACVGVAALVGGTVHGFFVDEGSIVGTVLWRLTLLALGGATFAAWSIGGRLVCSDRTARIVQAVAGVQCAAYAIVVSAIDQRFLVAIVNYAPSTVFLGIAFVVLYLRAHQRGTLSGLLGVLLTILAAVVQQLQIGIQSVHLTHNAFYHLIQMTALGLIFLAGRHVIANDVHARLGGTRSVTSS
jgi:uncharacterized protein DUF6962